MLSDKAIKVKASAVEENEEEIVVNQMRLRDSVQQHIKIKSDNLFEDQGLDILA